MKFSRMIPYLFVLPVTCWGMSASEIDAELEKISVYRSQGVKGPELDRQEAELKQLRASRSAKKEKKIEVKRMVREQTTTRKARPQDYLEFLGKLEDKNEKLAALQGKLAIDREALSSALQSDKRDDGLVSALRDRIDVLEAEKSRLESSISKSEVENRLSALKVGGMFDFYYMHSSNGNGDNKGTTSKGDDTLSGRYYDNVSDDFTINYAEISLAAKLDRTSFLMETVFGETPEQNAPGDEIGKHIGQAFISHDFDGKHSVTVGKMYTHVGYEVTKSLDNWNYSRANAYGYGIPFWHEGAGLKGQYENGLRWGLFVYDRTDARRDTNHGKNYGAQLGWTGEKLSFTYNVITGPERDGNSADPRTIHEVIGQYNASSNLAFALDLLTGKDVGAGGDGFDQEWSSVAGYVNWKATEKWRFAYRSEWFGETTKVGATTYRFGGNSPVDIVGQTITAAYSLGNRNEVRLEMRHDGTNAPLYKDGDASLKNNQDTISLSWMIGF